MKCICINVEPIYEKDDGFSGSIINATSKEALCRCLRWIIPQIFKSYNLESGQHQGYKITKFYFMDDKIWAIDHNTSTVFTIENCYGVSANKSYEDYTFIQSELAKCEIREEKHSFDYYLFLLFLLVPLNDNYSAEYVASAVYALEMLCSERIYIKNKENYHLNVTNSYALNEDISFVNCLDKLRNDRTVHLYYDRYKYHGVDTGEEFNIVGGPQILCEGFAKYIEEENNIILPYMQNQEGDPNFANLVKNSNISINENGCYIAEFASYDNTDISFHLYGVPGMLHLIFVAESDKFDEAALEICEEQNEIKDVFKIITRKDNKIVFENTILSAECTYGDIFGELDKSFRLINSIFRSEEIYVCQEDYGF